MSEETATAPSVVPEGTLEAQPAAVVAQAATNGDDETAKRSAEAADAQDDEENPNKRPTPEASPTSDAAAPAMSMPVADPSMDDPPPIPEGQARVQVNVKDDQIGRLIGKGGSNVKFMQSSTQTDIFIPKTCAHGTDYRSISITGSFSAVQKCKEMIEASTKEEIPEEQLTKVITVPDDQVGLLIGKGGSTIRHLQELSGAHVDIAKACNPGETQRELTISGEISKVAKCEQYIQMKLAGEPLPSLSSLGTPGLDVFTVKIPNNLVGRIIGKGGQTAREIQKSSKVYLDIEKVAKPGSSHRDITIRGNPRQVAISCQQMNNILCETTRSMYQYVDMPPEIAAVVATLPSTYNPQQQQQGYGGYQRQGGMMGGSYGGGSSSSYYQQPQQQYYGGYQQGGQYGQQQAGQQQQQQYYQQAYGQYGQQQQAGQQQAAGQQPQQQAGYDYSQYYQQQQAQPQQGYDMSAYQQQYAQYYQQQQQGQDQ